VDQVVRGYQECFDIYSPDVPITEEQICADVPEGGKGVCSVNDIFSAFSFLLILF